MDLIDVLEYWQDERECRRLLLELRWPNGVACPRCGNLHISWITTRFTFRGGLVCLNSAARFDKWNRAAVR